MPPTVDRHRLVRTPSLRRPRPPTAGGSPASTIPEDLTTTAYRRWSTSPARPAPSRRCRSSQEPEASSSRLPARRILADQASTVDIASREPRRSRRRGRQHQRDHPDRRPGHEAHPSSPARPRLAPTARPFSIPDERVVQRSAAAGAGAGQRHGCRTLPARAPAPPAGAFTFDVGQLGGDPEAERAFLAAVGASSPDVEGQVVVGRAPRPPTRASRSTSVHDHRLPAPTTMISASTQFSSSIGLLKASQRLGALHPLVGAVRPRLASAMTARITSAGRIGVEDAFIPRTGAQAGDGLRSAAQCSATASASESLGSTTIHDAILNDRHGPRHQRPRRHADLTRCSARKCGWSAWLANFTVPGRRQVVRHAPAERERGERRRSTGSPPAGSPALPTTFSECDGVAVAWSMAAVLRRCGQRRRPCLRGACPSARRLRPGR